MWSEKRNGITEAGRSNEEEEEKKLLHCHHVFRYNHSPQPFLYIFIG